MNNKRIKYNEDGLNIEISRTHNSLITFINLFNVHAFLMCFSTIIIQILLLIFISFCEIILSVFVLLKKSYAISFNYGQCQYLWFRRERLNDKHYFERKNNKLKESSTCATITDDGQKIWNSSQRRKNWPKKLPNPTQNIYPEVDLEYIEFERSWN